MLLSNYLGMSHTLSNPIASSNYLVTLRWMWGDRGREIESDNKKLTKAAIGSRIKGS